MDIPGPAGMLEAELTAPATNAGRWAVLCHPHPQYGGTMHDHVLTSMEAVLLGAEVINLNDVGMA